jgi:diaminopimelate epimerase
MGVPPLHFRKMNGLGNDFVVVDGRNLPIAFSKRQISSIANRVDGIGCDQFITMEGPSSSDAVVFMRIHNADGGEVEACGNAARCVGWIVLRETGTDDVVIETSGGVLHAIPGVRPFHVTVDMGAPRFDWRDIPLSEPCHDTRAIDVQLGAGDGSVVHPTSAVNVGNPHAVFWVDDVDAIDLARMGPVLERHRQFPQRANISIAQIDARDRIKMRVWERGVGLTLACGTGACAVAVCAARNDMVDRMVQVALPGGPLDIDWRTGDDHIHMSGPIALDFEGHLDPQTLEWSRASGDAV